MKRRFLTFKLNTHPVRGKLSICHDLNHDPYIRAVLTIPDEGVLREAFLAHLSGPYEDRMTLEWTELEEDTFSTYNTQGIILNRQFPNTLYAIFKSVAPIVPVQDM
jgi:hypothetical protein